MGKPSAPPPPDYAAAATAQGQANVTSAQNQASLNNPNITGPYGSQMVSYQPTGPNGDEQAYINQTLTPEAQQALTSQQQVQAALGGLAQQGIGTAQDVLGQPFQYNGPGIQTNVNTSGVAPAAINPGTSAYQAQLNLLQPQITQSNQALTQQLANQGIPVGSEAYNNAMRAQGNQNASLLDNVAANAVGLQQSANQQGYNQALQSGEFGNTAAQQALSQQLGLYNQPLNEITALMSGSQIQSPQFQQYTGGGNIQAAPVYNAAVNQGNYDTAAYNAQMQGLGGLFGGLGNIAGSALGTPQGASWLFG